MRTSQGVKCAGSHQVEDDGTMLALKRDGRAQDALTACAELVRQSDGCGEHFAYDSGAAECFCVPMGDSCAEREISVPHNSYVLTDESDLPTAAAPLRPLPKPKWMDAWKIKWHQERQQWWDAQRKRYRPQVWAAIDRLASYGIYTTLDFRPEMDK